MFEKGSYMTTIDIVARELLHESLKTYLYRRLSKVESEIIILAKKYGIKVKKR